MTVNQANQSKCKRKYNRNCKW